VRDAPEVDTPTDGAAATAPTGSAAGAFDILSSDIEPVFRSDVAPARNSPEGIHHLVLDPVTGHDTLGAMDKQDLADAQIRL
jgi:hypothetical protein